MGTKITGTNTAAAPGVTGDDTDTGLFYGTNEIGFSTGGTSRLTLDSSGNLNIPNDSGKIQFGTDNDLAIYHDGHSRIKTASGAAGNLVIDSNNDINLRVNNSEMAVHCKEDGAVELYFDNAKKAETVTGGFTVTGVCTATSFAGSGASLTGISSQDTLSFRNLVINGNMTVAQRATSYTSDQQGYRTVDRFGMEWNGADAVLEQHQVDVTNSGHTGAWEAGFRKAWKIVNGNQSSGAGAADYAQLYHKIEAFNMAYSGWDYKDTNKDITLQFWVRSSVAQNFQCALVTDDGTDKQYTFEYTISSANTWTKITKTIPGHADLEFHTNIGLGMTIYWSLFHGTDMTTSTGNLNQWANWGGNDDWKDMTSTWWTTNDAEFWVTGVQLEVGDTATTFEHMPVADNLARCQRYYYKKPMFYSACMTYTPGSGEHNFTRYGTDHPVEMRSAPSFVGGDFACWSWSSATGIAKANITYSGDHGTLASSLSVACTAANGAAPANGPGSGNMVPCRQLDSEFNAEL